jgi:hypothetical protein
MKLNFGAYMDILYRHMIPQPKLYPLVGDLLASACDKDLKEEVKGLDNPTRTNYYKCNLNVKKPIKQFYKKAGVFEKVCTHFSEKIISSLKDSPIDDLLAEFRRLIENDISEKESDDKEKRHLLELAGMARLSEQDMIAFLARTFIFALPRNNKIKYEMAGREASSRTVSDFSMDQLAQTVKQSVTEQLQEQQNDMITSFYQITMLHHRITPNAGEEYTDYDGPKDPMGLPCGHGTAKFSGGRLYKGNWMGGKRCGHGFIITPAVEISVNWKDDKMDGMAYVTFKLEGMEHWSQEIPMRDGIPCGDGVTKGDGEKSIISWHGCSDGSLNISQTIYGLELEYTLAPNRKITIIGECDDEAPHHTIKMEGYYYFVGSKTFLGEGLFSIEGEDGRREVYRGTLSMPDLDLQGYGELTIEDESGKSSWRGAFRDDKLHGYGVEECDGFRYEGFFVNNIRHGWGKLFAPSGNVIHVGQWENGRFHGRGRITYSDKSTYVGQWWNGKFHGRGKRVLADQSTYVGEWKDGAPHGRGTMKYTDGSTYVGQWKKGLFNGLGTLTNPDGKVAYVGVWRCDKMHGRGTYYREDGTKAYVGESIDRIPHGRGTGYDEAGTIVYEGEFYNGHYHGHGTKWFPDGSKYTGQWDAGCQHGRGKMVWAHGTYAGEWQNDKPHGRGVFKSAKGWSYTGEWVDEQAHGFGIRKEADGTIEKGLFELSKFIHGRSPEEEVSLYKGESITTGVPHGYGECLYPDFRKYKGEWKEGKRHGMGVLIHPDGTTVEGEWKNDHFVMPGRAVVRYGRGSIYEGEINAAGEYHGVGKLIQEDGTISEGEWVNGAFTGKGEVIYPSSRHEIGDWVKGKLNGFGQITGSDGRMHKGTWRNGTLAPDDFTWMVRAHGEFFFSEMKNGMQNGRNMQIGPGSKTIVSQFVDDKPVPGGDVTVVFANGGQYQGGRLDGKFHGYGKRVFSDGSVVHGTWENGNFTGNGNCLTLFPCESMYCGELVNRIRQGHGVLKSLDGKGAYIQKGTWENGVLSGKCKLIFSDGEMFRGLYKEGAAVGRGALTLRDGRKGEGEIIDGRMEFFPLSET